ncbi:MAG: polysaccharide pyruvyl transferase family protein [Clostridiaceae bacterium]|nr:polysaccharide pyruvyl transferase family protein [Clostridiaceae bacterium]
MKIKEDKLVSVVIPVCNGTGMLGKTIDSVLRQSYRNYEIVLVDDALTDQTFDYVSGAYGDLENLVYIINDQKLGLAASVNVGVSSARGELVTFLCCGGEWSPDSLKNLVFALAGEGQTETVGMAYGTAVWETADGGRKITPPADFSHKQGNIYPVLLLTPLIDLSSACIRRKLFFDFGGLPEELLSMAWDAFCVRVARQYEIRFADGAVANMGAESDGEGKKPEEKLEFALYLMETYDADLKRLGLREAKFENVLGEMGNYGLRGAFLKKLGTGRIAAYYLQQIKNFLDKNSRFSSCETISGKTVAGVRECIGCGCCEIACPVGAVVLQADEEGFLYPALAQEKCIECGACKASCPRCVRVSAKSIPEQCIAAAAADAVRMESSSGGMFTVFAEQFLQKGGWICGAVYTEDYHVEHIVSNQREALARMRGSKYIQSDTRAAFRRIKELLERGETVFFTGTPCQNAALQVFLKDIGTEKLYTADVVCHGVAGYECLMGFLEESGYQREKIQELSFRKKKYSGWSVETFVQYGDQPHILGEADYFMDAYLNNWLLRDACYHCSYKNGKYSDLSLGDFWSNMEKDDGLGTSYLSIHSKKGETLWQMVKDGLKQWEGRPFSQALAGNRCLVESVEKQHGRTVFAGEWKKHRSFLQAGKSARASLQFDAALVVMWSQNYGNAMTNYALYHYLEKLGKKVLCLDNFCVLKPEAQFLDFAKQEYTLSSAYFPKGNYNLLCQCCDTFVVGSDQVWNCSYEPEYGYGTYFYLERVSDDCRKVSYASSFGRPDGAIDADRGRKLYQRFDAISVRDDFAPELCEKLYGVSAQKVLDPVFLLEGSDYAKLAETSGASASGYVVAYLLDPSFRKKEICEKISREYGLQGVKYIIDANPSGRIFHKLELDFSEDILEDLRPQDWLALLQSAAVVVTDSFHGVCFSVLFEKPFIGMLNRESSRFSDFRRLGNAFAGIVHPDMELPEILRRVYAVDFDAVRRDLAVEREHAGRWLKEAVRELR